MTRKPPRILSVYIDKRENIPVKFPGILTHWPRFAFDSAVRIRVNITPKRLPAGDYVVRQVPEVGFETKRSMTELASNLLSPDRTRFLKALDKLVDTYHHPYLIYDDSWNRFHMTPRIPQMACDLNHERIHDLLLAELIPRHIHLIISSSRSVKGRVQLGTLMLRIALGHLAERLESADEDANFNAVGDLPKR
jgi:ERCC4-type nuclease